MDKQEIMNNLELIFANMTEDEKKEYMKKNDKAKEIFLGLKLIQIKYGKLEEEKLKNMPQKEREKFEKEKAFDEKVNSVIEEVYDKRTEKFERQKDQGQDENIDEYVDLFSITKLFTSLMLPVNFDVMLLSKDSCCLLLKTLLYESSL